MKVEEGVDGETTTENSSRGLLHRFSLCTGGGGVAEKTSYKSPNKDTEELELCLGFSLGGKFGIEKSTTQLVRSASVAGALPFTTDEDLSSISRLLGSLPSIIWTSSRPTEAEEEFRKRKEWQSLRHLDARNRGKWERKIVWMRLRGVNEKFRGQALFFGEWKGARCSSYAAAFQNALFGHDCWAGPDWCWWCW